MPLSPYFLQGSSSEQRLVQDLINEQLKIYGQDIVYLPRKIINKKTIMKHILAVPTRGQKWLFQELKLGMGR